MSLPNFNDYRAREQLLGYDEDLLDCRVLLVGAGAVGGAVAQILAMWGFRRATVVDHDHFEPSNAARVTDFPFAEVASGAAVSKARHTAARWRERLVAAGETAEGIVGLKHYAQELDPRHWREADLAISVVDHPRARYDVARLARRYDVPLVTGGFDGEARGVSASVYPALQGAACLACIARAPSYAASDTSCSAHARRAREREKLPATPALATLCAGLVAQLAVDALHAPTAHAFTVRSIASSAASSVPHFARAEPSPTCAQHREDWRPVALSAHATSLGEVLDGLERQIGRDVALMLPCELPVFAPSDAAAPALLRVALPPWRIPGRDLERHFERAPRGTLPTAVDRLDLLLARQLGLVDLPVALFGLGPGARFEVEAGESIRGLEWETSP